ncbi:hypothetical protein DXD18_08975, partial [Dorea formicigenerans]
VVVSATAYLYYHIRNRLSTTFLNLFFTLFTLDISVLQISFIRISRSSTFVNNFFILFSSSIL